jgi:hypothetical protein
MLITLTAQYVIEVASPDDEHRTTSYATTRIKGALKDIRGANAATAVWDSNDIMIGVDVTGTPGDDLLKAIAEFYEEESV